MSVLPNSGVRWMACGTGKIVDISGCQPIPGEIIYLCLVAVMYLP